MQYNDLINRLQNLTDRNLTDRLMMEAFGLKSPSTIVYKRQNNVYVNDDEIKKIEQFFNIDLNETSINEDCITLEHIGINPSCGKGTDVYFDPRISPIQLGINLIKTFFKVSHPKNLKTFTASGDSMNPVIEHGDLILVDVGDIDFVNGGVFLLTIDNNWFIKRLRKRITGELDIISDNPKYPVETLQMDTFKEVSIKGRVIKNLSRGL